MISYAQNFEDVMLWRALKHIKHGFYIDVGANDPTNDSVTKCFYDNGWRGINIEPVAKWFKKLEIERVRDINLQVAVGANQGEFSFYEFSDTGISTFDIGIAKQHKEQLGLDYEERLIIVNTLTDICEKYPVPVIHFLKIDVEGSEKLVIEGFDLRINRPWIIIVESVFPSTQKESFEHWETILLTAQYEFVYFDGLNRYYVISDQKDIIRSFQTPPNLFDGFVLGGTGSSSFQQHQADSNVQNDRLIAELNQSSAESAQLASQLNQSRAESSLLASQLNQSRAESAQLASQLNQSRAESAQLDSQLNQSRAENAQLDSQLNQSRAESAQLASQLNQSRAESAQLASQLNQSRAENTLLITATSDQTIENKMLEATLNQLNITIATTELELSKAQSEITKSNDLIRYWKIETDDLNTQIKAIYSSLSWRMTSPFRKLLLLAMWLFKLAVRIVIVILNLPKNGVRGALSILKSFIIKRPRIKKATDRWILKNLGLYYFMSRLGLTPSKCVHQQNDTSKLAQNLAAEQKFNNAPEPSNQVQPEPSIQGEPEQSIQVQPEKNTLKVRTLEAALKWHNGRRLDV